MLPKLGHYPNFEFDSSFEFQISNLESPYSLSPKYPFT